MRLQLRPPGLGQPWRHRPALLAVPFGLIVVIMVLDLVTGKDIQLGPLLVVAPALTAMIGGVRLTALAGVLAVGAQILLSALLGGVTTANHQTQTVALFLVSLFVVAFRAVHERHERALLKVRWIADVAQKVLLRPLPDRVGALRIASVYVAAEAEAQIGGDLYAVAPGRYGTRFLIGDVRGKGLPAVGDAALLLGAFRAAAHRNPPLARLVAHLHNAVYWNTVDPTGAPDDGESFVTAAIVEVPADEELVRLISCGHPPPLLLRDGQVTFLTAGDPALPLGVGGELSEEDYASETFSYRGGDVLLLYTDGVVEARDSQGAFYDLAGNVGAWNETEPRRLVQLIHESLLAHAGGSLDDDAAFVAVERHA